MSFLNKNILIIGGSGFIGSHLCSAAKSKGMNVTNISLKKQVKGVQNYNFNISSKDSFQADIKKKKFHYIINCGGYINHSDFSLGGDNIIEQHLGGLYNLINLLDLKELIRLVQLGSSDEYGLINAPQSEDDKCFPSTPYSYSRYSASKFLEMLGKNNNLKFTTIRLFLVYGPNQKKDRFLPYVINSFIENKEPKLTPGDQLRDFTFIDDIVSGVIKVHDSPPIANEERNEMDLKAGSSIAPWKVYNIGNNSPVKLMDYISSIESTLGITAKLELLPMQPGDVLETYADVSSLKADFDYNPATEVKEGVKKFVEWYLDYYGIE